MPKIILRIIEYVALKYKKLWLTQDFYSKQKHLNMKFINQELKRGVLWVSNARYAVANSSLVLILWLFAI